MCIFAVHQHFQRVPSLPNGIAAQSNGALAFRAFSGKSYPTRILF
jgi:hypothetical protein